MKKTILIVDDNPSIRQSLKLLLEKDYNPIEVSSGEDALALLQNKHVDVILLDIQMKGMDGIQTLKKIRERDEHVIIIMLTVIEDIKVAINTIKLGANDYLNKPYDKDELLLILNQNLAMKDQNFEMQYLRSEREKKYESNRIIGNSPAIKTVYNLIDKAAKSHTTVFITGETGTGKELIAHELHQRSDRKNRPFVVINCAAIPRELVESELFGHEKGSFTGAHKQKLGKIEIAGNGVVFFDEIGSLPLELQGKFLRVLQEKSFERVGSTVTIPTNARFIFATNDDLKQAIKNGTFREDLYYRINVLQIKIPPLRERREDIPLLVDHFLTKYSHEQRKSLKKVTKQVMDVFKNYSWEGNIRQLENEIEKVITLANDDDQYITIDLISEDIRLTAITNDEPESNGLLNNAVESLEKKLIHEALAKFHGNKTRAAEYLGISRRGFHKKLDRYKIKTSDEFEF